MLESPKLVGNKMEQVRHSEGVYRCQGSTPSLYCFNNILDPKWYQIIHKIKSVLWLDHLLYTFDVNLCRGTSFSKTLLTNKQTESNNQKASVSWLGRDNELTTQGKV